MITVTDKSNFSYLLKDCPISMDISAVEEQEMRDALEENRKYDVNYFVMDDAECLSSMISENCTRRNYLPRFQCGDTLYIVLPKTEIYQVLFNTPEV